MADHGTVTRYRSGCRCDTCRANESARTNRHRQARLEKAASGQLPDSVEHGLSAAVNWGCRCEVCAAAMRERNKNLVERARRGEIEHTRGGGNKACPCETCKSWRKDQYEKHWRQQYEKMMQDESWRKKKSKKTMAINQRLNDASRESARRNYYIWTGPELEIVSRTDLTASAAAKILGRTIAAVNNQRRLLRRGDPKKTNLLGAEHGDESE